MRQIKLDPTYPIPSHPIFLFSFLLTKRIDTIVTASTNLDSLTLPPRMSPKERGKSPQTSHGTEVHEMTDNQRSSSLASQSRLARRAAAMAQMNALELTSIKAEMERLREENRSLRGIIQQLGSLEVIEDSDENYIQSVDGNSETDANTGLGYSIPIATLCQEESEAAILGNLSSDSFGTITYSSLGRGIEHLGESTILLPIVRY